MSLPGTFWRFDEVPTYDQADEVTYRFDSNMSDSESHPSDYWVFSYTKAIENIFSASAGNLFPFIFASL